MDKLSGISDVVMVLGRDYEEVTVRLSFSPAIDRRRGEAMILDTLAAARERLGHYGFCTVLHRPGPSYPAPHKNSATTSCESPLSAPGTNR